MNSDETAIIEAASDWLARKENGWSRADEQRFARWLIADPRHGKIFAEIEQSWLRLDQLTGSEQATRLEAELTEIEDRTSALRRTRFLSGSWMAIAASLALVAAFMTLKQNPNTAPERSSVVTTTIGALREMTLSDGSTVRLNTSSALSVDFSASERRIRLAEGEGFFVVAKDAARPFIVTIGNVDVRAVGTEFNVRQFGDAVEIIVREGRVRVEDTRTGSSLITPSSDQTEPEILHAGHRLRLSLSAQAGPFAAAPIVVPVSAIDQSLAWQQRRLVFISSPLSEIVTEYNRYLKKKLVIEDPTLGSKEFGGTFEARSAKTFLELLTSSFDVEVVDRGDTLVLRRKS